jgi:hypothetical protein
MTLNLKFKVYCKNFKSKSKEHDLYIFFTKFIQNNKYLFMAFLNNYSKPIFSQKVIKDLFLYINIILYFPFNNLKNTQI